MERDLDTGFDLDHRELCPDGACMGVIGDDGRCKICGTPSPNGPPPTAVPSEEAAAADGHSAGDPAEAPSSPAPGPRAAEGDEFDPEARELCPDGTCMGVIGADGRCKICGTPAP